MNPESPSIPASRARAIRTIGQVSSVPAKLVRSPDYVRRIGNDAMNGGAPNDEEVKSPGRLSGRSIAILLTSGILFVFLAIFLVSLAPSPVKSPSSIDYGHANLELVTTTSLPGTRGSDDEERNEYHSRIELTYPREIRENQTSVVSLRIEAFIDRAVIDATSKQETARSRISDTLELDEYGALRLTSSGFDIAPDQEISKPAGTPLPTEYAWTISPKREGEHNLLLDLSGFIGPLQENQQLESVLAVNERPLVFGDTRVLRLDVIVKTPWGVGGTTMALIRALIALIGFVLVYPVVAEWIKLRTFRRKS